MAINIIKLFFLSLLIPICSSEEAFSQVLVPEGHHFATIKNSQELETTLLQQNHYLSIQETLSNITTNEATCVNCNSSLIANTSNPRRICQEEIYFEPKTDAIIQSISLTVMIIGGILRPTNMGLLFAVSLVKNIKYLDYLDLKLSEKISKGFFLNIRPFSGVLPIQMSENMKNTFSSGSLPTAFSQENSNYLVNQWDFLFTLLVLISLALVFYLVKLAVTSQPNNKFFFWINRLELLIRWNLILFIVVTNCPEVTFYSILQFQTIIMRSSYSTFSLICCILMVCFSFCVLIKILFICSKLISHQNSTDKQSLISCRELEYSSIYSGYKSDSLLQQSYVFYFAVRAILSNLIIGIFYNYPLFQLILIISLNISMLTYLLLEKPIVGLLTFRTTFFLEALILTIDFGLVILSCSSDITNFQDIISNTIFIIESILSFCSHISIWGDTGFVIYSIFKEAKQQSTDGKICWQGVYQVLSNNVQGKIQDCQIISLSNPNSKQTDPRKLDNQINKSQSNDFFKIKILREENPLPSIWNIDGQSEFEETNGNSDNNQEKISKGRDSDLESQESFQTIFENIPIMKGNNNLTSVVEKPVKSQELKKRQFLKSKEHKIYPATKSVRLNEMNSIIEEPTREDDKEYKLEQKNFSKNLIQTEIKKMFRISERQIVPENVTKQITEKLSQEKSFINTLDKLEIESQIPKIYLTKENSCSLVIDSSHKLALSPASIVQINQIKASYKFDHQSTNTHIFL